MVKMVKSDPRKVKKQEGFFQKSFKGFKKIPNSSENLTGKYFKNCLSGHSLIFTFSNH